MKHLVAIVLLIFGATAFSQAPNHTRLLYSHDLRSVNANGIGKIDNLGGTFTSAGWKTSASSQLRILFKDFLPHEGTVEFKMTGLNAANVPSKFDWVAASLYSRGEASFDLNLSPASFFLLKMDNKLFTDFNRSFKMFVSPFGIEAGGKNGNLESYYPVGIMDWDNPGAEYTIRLIWGRPAGTTDGPARFWFQVVETGNMHSLAFEGQIESFAYLCLGRDDTYNESVPNVIYKDLKVYGAASETPFTNVAFSTNTRSEKNIGSQGAAVADIDGNGNEDIYVSFFYNTDRDSDNLLFVEQNNDTFEEEGAARNVNNPKWSYGSMVADFDLDGDLDIFSGNYSSQNKLYYNNGSGVFSDVTNARGISSDADDTKGAAIIDLENDGDTDIIVVNGATNHKVYRNNGSGTFALATTGIESYVGSKSAKFQSAAVGDLNGDGFQDVILARQYGPSLMFINSGNGTFTEQSVQRGFSISKSVNSVNLGDIDNDGDLDIVCGITTDSNAPEPLNDVFRNDGNGNFTNITGTANITLNGYGVSLGDWDNDGDLDLFGVRRHGRFSRVYINDGSGAFTLQQQTGAEIRTEDGRGVTNFDYNNDGFLDIYVASRGGEAAYSHGVMPYSRNYLLRNDAAGQNPNNHYLKVAIYNDANSPGGLATKIWAYAPGGMGNSNSLIAYREVSATSGFQSQRSYIQHLGLGTHSTIDVRIQLPDGSVKEYPNIGVDQQLDIFPGQVVPDKIVVENCDQQGKAGAPLAQKVRVKTLSADNQPAANITVDFRILSGNGKLESDLMEVNKITGGDGYAEVTWIMGQTAGVVNQLEIRAFHNGGQLSGSPHVCTITPTANDPAKIIKVSGDGQSEFAGRLLPQPIEVKVTDLFDNPISGFAVDFDITSGGGSLSNGGGSQQVQTDAGGVARINWTLGAQVGEQTLQASGTFNGSPLMNSPLVFTATANEILNQMLYQSGNGQSAIVGQQLANPLIVKIQNNLDEPVAGAQVRFIVVEGGGSFSGNDTLALVTDTNGLAGATPALGFVAGDTNNVFHAVSDEAFGSPIVFKASGIAAAAANLLKVSGDKQEGPAGNVLPQPVIVQVTDQYNNPVSGFAVNYKVRGGGTINGDADGTLSTNPAGQILATLTLRKTVGIDTVSFAADGLAGSPVLFTATAVPGDPFKLVEISGNHQTGSPGQPLEKPFVVSVQDQFGNDIAGHEVQFAVTGGGGSIDGAAEKTVTTGDDGWAQVSLTLGPSEGAHTVSASSQFNGAPLQNSPVLFTAATGPGDPERLAVYSGNNQRGVVGIPLQDPLTAIVTDKNGYGVPGIEVEFAAVSPGAHLGGNAVSKVKTDSAGIASVVATLGGNYGDNVFTASARFNGVPLQGAPIQFRASARKSWATTMSALGDTAITASAGTMLENVLQVVVTGSSGQPVAGHPVAFERISGLCSLNGGSTSVSVLSNESGVASVSVQLAAQPDISVVEASSDDGVVDLEGSPVSFVIHGIVGPPDPAKSTVIGQSPVVADGATVSTIEVKLRDSVGNAISGKEVTLFASGLDVTLQQPQNPTDETGTTRGGIVSANVGSVRVWAVADGVNLAPDTLRFVAGPPSKMIAFGNNQFAQKGTALPDPVGVILQDEWSHFVTGHQVDFVVIRGGGSVDNGTVYTDEGGKARVHWTLGNEREQELRALIAGFAEPVVFNAVALSPGNATLKKVSGDSTIGLINQPLEAPFVVQLVDTTGAELPNESIQFEIVEGEGSFVTSSRPVTDGEGKAQVTFKAGAATGLHKIRASAVDIANTMVDFHVMILDKPTIFLSKHSQDGQTFRPFETVDVSVFAGDAFGRPLTGKEIGWMSAAGGIYVATDELILTDSSGIATATATIGPAGPQELKMFSTKASSDTISFYFESQNAAPRFVLPTTGSDTTIVSKADTLISFIVAASDDDFDPVHFGCTTLPQGAQFDSTRSLFFSWIPTSQQEGEYSVTFRARDDFGGRDTLRVTFVIGDGNQPPILVSRFPTSKTIAPKLNEPLKFKVVYQDPEGAPLSYKWYINQAVYPTASTTDSIIVIFDVSHQPAVIVRVEISDGDYTLSEIWGVDLVSLVELTSFSAQPLAGGIQVSWQSAGETGNTGYSLLRSLSEKGPWESLSGFIAARSSGSYSYLDQSVSSGETYYYKLIDIAENGVRSEHGPVTAVASRPERISLAQNYPNPFNPTTVIAFELDEARDVSLVLYNMAGQAVKTLVSGFRNAGYHRVEWNATNDEGTRVPSGIYYYQLKTDEAVLTRKLVLLK